jgi:hypothetical protein
MIFKNRAPESVILFGYSVKNPIKKNKIFVKFLSLQLNFNSLKKMYFITLKFAM